MHANLVNVNRSFHGANFCIRMSNFSFCLCKEQVAVNKWENYAGKYQRKWRNKQRYLRESH